MSDLLSIGSSAVSAYQRALGTVSNNIANVGTDGYVRQETALSESVPRNMGRAYLGTGVNVAGIRRAYDEFLEQNLRNTTSELNTQGPMVNYADRVVDILGSESIGLPQALDQFFASARSLSTDPASSLLRSQFLRDADGLASRFRELSSQVSSVDTETRDAITSRVADINTLSQQIATVNKKLARHTILDRQPPDLLDQRDLLLKQLSALVNIKVSTAPNGQVDVSIGNVANAGAIVTGAEAIPLEARFDDNDLSRVAIIADPYSKAPQEVAGIGSGELGGLLGFREQVLESTMRALDTLATRMADEINAIHRDGMDARGDVGGDLFTISKVPVTDARSGEVRLVDRAAAGIRVAIDDPSRVAAAATFRVIESDTNLSGADANLSYAASHTNAAPVLSSVIRNNDHPSAGVQPTTAGQPFAQIPVGADNWSLYLDGATGLQNFQVFTRDGRHLLGAGIDSIDAQDALLRPENGFVQGSTYSEAYLNRSGEYGYKQMAVFYGDRAIPGSQISQSAEITAAHQALPSYRFNEVDDDHGKLVPAGLASIPSGTLMINGRSLPLAMPRAPATELQASDLARWISDGLQGSEPPVTATAMTTATLAIDDPADGFYINGYAVPADAARSGATGIAAIRDIINQSMGSTAKVIAEVDADGHLVIGNAPGYEGDDIRIGAMASNGDPFGQPLTYKGQLSLHSDADIILGYGPEGGDGALELIGRPVGTYYTEQLPVEPTDAVLNGAVPIGRDLFSIAGDTLSLNGKTLEKLELLDLDGHPIELQASDMAEWLNRTGDALKPPVVATATTVIHASSLKLDGIAGLTLDGIAVTGPFDGIGDLVQAINGNAALRRAGIGATDDGKGGILLQNVLGHDIIVGGSGTSSSNALGVANGKYKGSLQLVSDGEIRLGFAGDGNAAELAKLGMRAGLHIDGALSEDLLVFVTGEGAGTVSGSFDASIADPASLDRLRLQTLRAQDFTVEFTSTSSYQITWANPQNGVKTVLAERRYDALSGIDYQGLKLTLNRPPAAGDRFTLDGNQDGTGNNENILSLLALERKAVISGPNGGTIAQVYEQAVANVGNVSSQAQVAQKALEVVNNQAIDARDKVSGVSLDSEAADLIRFQQAYQAAAKTIQVAGDLFDAILQAAR